MNIIPDVLGNLRPTVDLSLVLRGHPTPVEPGSFLTAGQASASAAPALGQTSDTWT